MARDDIWIYQERDVKEPWALHLWLINNGTIDISVYAEWLPHGSKRMLGVKATFDELIDALTDLLGDYGQILENEDISALNRHWVKFAIKNELN